MNKLSRFLWRPGSLRQKPKVPIGRRPLQIKSLTRDSRNHLMSLRDNYRIAREALTRPRSVAQDPSNWCNIDCKFVFHEIKKLLSLTMYCAGSDIL